MRRSKLLICSLWVIFLFGHTLQAASRKFPILTGAEQLEAYLPLLKNQSVALVANASSQIHGTHLLDILLAQGVNVKVVLAPEHGFRGQQDAGVFVEEDTLDEKSGIPIISLYKEKTRKVTPSMLEGIDAVIFDIQDVGVRFFTYISTLHYVMEGCAANEKPLILLDRPNPNAHYIDGPVLEKKFQSFLGKHPIPLVYGLTIGELARMINGEGWLVGGIRCDLTIIKLKNYTHQTSYQLPVPPSPNLTNKQAILLYPSLGIFEGTFMSVGRGTNFPFQVVGYPDKRWGSFGFIPGPKAKYADQFCYGLDLRKKIPPRDRLDLSYLLNFYSIAKKQKREKDFFIVYGDRNSFDYHMGTSMLRKQIQQGVSEKEIRASWQADLEKYKSLRAKYLLYP
eukprot:gene261-344_t